ncbi:hypothetical protein P7C70_g8281, partial [Phenoliferia sp. Uapishka_3]
ASQGWANPGVQPRTPPRRRQAQAVAVYNATTSGSDLFVFGGIAEKYTCSSETIGYFGVDRWDTVAGTVETLPWDPPANADATFAVPVSDYTATLLADNTSIVLVGGQTASGNLVGMETVLVFNSKLRTWLSLNTTGPTPDPRMGHVAVALDSGAILIHGGVGLDRTPVASVHILTPSFNLNSTSTPSWAWSTAYLSNDSLDAPSRAWHTATLVKNGVIVVAFGIDAAIGSPSSDLFFLTIDNQGSCSWNGTFEGDPNIFVAEIKPIKAVTNPKATMLGPSDSTPSDGTTTTTTSDSTSPLPTTSATTPTLAASLASPSPSVGTVDPTSQAADAAAAKRRTVAVSVGSIAGAAALLGLAGLILRRRYGRNNRGVQLAETSPTFAHGAPFVSTLLYTRPVGIHRVLSLGSTVSARSSPSPSDSSSVGSQTEGIRGLGASRDPFSDAHIVNEIGQLARAPSMTNQNSLGSVLSAPYLHAVHRTRSRDDDGGDSFTSMPPSLRSIRTQRAPSSSEGMSVEQWDAFADEPPSMTAVSRQSSQTSTLTAPSIALSSSGVTGRGALPALPRSRPSLSIRNNADP